MTNSEKAMVILAEAQKQQTTILLNMSEDIGSIKSRTATMVDKYSKLILFLVIAFLVAAVPSAASTMIKVFASGGLP